MYRALVYFGVRGKPWEDAVTFKPGEVVPEEIIAKYPFVLVPDAGSLQGELLMGARPAWVEYVEHEDFTIPSLEKQGL